MLGGLLHKEGYRQTFTFISEKTGFFLLIFILFFILVEWIGREQHYAIAKVGLNWPKPVRWAFYYCIVLCIFYFAGGEQQFIYFQF